MARPKKWKGTKLEDGIQTVTLASWKYFTDYITQRLADYTTYIFRGHASDRWMLEPTLDRELKKINKLKTGVIRRKHLEGFKYAVRGRRGQHPPIIENDNDWWALGQHHGLSTPLLDWTESPFVALYFAFFDPENSDTEYRVVYAISRVSIKRKSTELNSLHKEPSRSHIVEIVRPLSDENSRLVNQRGLFTRGPDGVTLEDWIKSNFSGETEKSKLIKIKIPDKERQKCLQALNRMNINHLSLFPDLYGASKYCNTELIIDKY